MLMTAVYYKVTMWSVTAKTLRLCLVWAVSLVCFLCMNISSVWTGGSGDNWENGASAEQQSGNISFPLEHCGCVRTLPRPSPAEQLVEYRDTTCGRDAYNRQTCQPCLTRVRLKSA